MLAIAGVSRALSRAARWSAAACALAGAACGGGDGQPDAPPTGTATVRVDRYDYTLDLETRAAQTRVTLTLTSPGNCVALPSRAPMLDTGSVTLGGAPAAATADGVTLTACGAGWGAGTQLDLTASMFQPLSTWGGSQVGYSVTNDGSGEPLFYLISWVEGCDRFGPCDPTPSVFAHYRITVRHRSGVTALCPGVVTPGDTETLCTFDYAGGPTYSTFALVASPSWDVIELGSWGGVRAVLYDRPGSGIAPLVDAAYHQGFLAQMVSRFGAYPYGAELRIATGPTYWAGFEHPGNIVLDDALDRPMSSLYADPVAHTLNHEIAHQWAGDQTTLAGTYDFVWKEAMAEYLTFTYEDQTEPAVGLITARAWKAFAAGAAFYPVPGEQPPLLTYYGEVYGPGPMILFRQLEAMTSRAQVMTALASLLGSERAISVDDVQTALESATGLDLDTYFDTWVRGSGAPTWPTFRVELSGTAPDQMVTVTETTPGGVLHGCRFEVEVTGAGGETARVTIDRGVDGAAVVSARTEQSWDAVSTTLDPGATCLAYPDTTAAPPPRHPPGWTPWRGSRGW